MPPVKTVASSSDVDTEATAELPVLDVAAYESTLSDPIASTDTWAAPAPADLAAALPEVDATAIPTLRAADPEGVTDLSSTLEMLPLAKPNKIIKATPASHAATVPAPIVLPPSPPLIEELRNALAAAERRVEELNERARIADAERTVAVARTQTENAQLRALLGDHLESLHTARGRLDVQGAEQSALEDELFARAHRIDALQAELNAQAQTLAEVRAALEASEQRCARFEVDGINLSATLERRDNRIAALEADLAARQEREVTLKARLDDALAEIHPEAPDLRAQIKARDRRIVELTRELAATMVLATEKDADLQVAEESIHHLEIEVRDKTGKRSSPRASAPSCSATCASKSSKPTSKNVLPRLPTVRRRPARRSPSKDRRAS